MKRKINYLILLIFFICCVSFLTSCLKPVFPTYNISGYSNNTNGNVIKEEYGEKCYEIKDSPFYRRKTYYNLGIVDSANENIIIPIDCYYKNNDGICYVDCLSLYNIFKDKMSSDPNVFTNHVKDGILTISFIGLNKVIQSVVIDSNTNKVIISSPNYYSYYFDGEDHFEGNFYKYDITPFKEINISYNLSDYDLEAYLVEGNVVLPLSIFNLIFTQEIGYDYLYSNGKIYGLSNNSKEFEGKSNESVTKEIRELTYNYLLLFFHKYYGLSSYYGLDTVEDVKNYLAPYKYKLLSTNSQTFEKAEMEIFDAYIDDPHSSLTSYSLYHSSVFIIEGSKGERVQQLYSYNSKYSSDRNNKIGGYVKNNRLKELYVIDDGKKKNLAYVFDNTAIISFDSFSINASLKSPNKSNTEDDLFSLMYFALNEIDKYSMNNQKIENIVIDLTTNTGGFVIAGLELLSFMTNENVIWTYDYLNMGAYQSRIFKCDNDCNGDFDDLDAHTQYNWFIEISQVSFSCGNLVPYLAKEYGFAKILGLPSAGGMCTVGKGILPDGVSFNKSQAGNRNASTKEIENKDYRSCEDGVIPDVLINGEELYDLNSLSSAITMAKNK